MFGCIEECDDEECCDEDGIGEECCDDRDNTKVEQDSYISFESVLILCDDTDVTYLCTCNHIEIYMRYEGCSKTRVSK